MGKKGAIMFHKVKKQWVTIGRHWQVTLALLQVAPALTKVSADETILNQLPLRQLKAMLSSNA